MIGIPLGLVYANAGEWFIHKYLLHRLGRKRKSFWAFHWHDHHRASRKNGMSDPAYHEMKLAWDPRTKEAVTLTALTAAHLPLFPVAPFFTSTVVYSAVNYYRVHKRAHQDPKWARENLPWHYDHHMGPNQDSNWCVTRPFFDYVMGTRQEFVGSWKEKKTSLKPVQPACPDAALSA